MSFVLQYRAQAAIEDLQLGQCTVHRCRNGDAPPWWNLWFYVARETDGEPEVFVVPINPGGDFTEHGLGGRTWGFKRTSVGVWTVSPSINVLDDEGARLALAGHAPTGRSLWHQTPDVVYVPEHEPWMDL